MADKSITLYGAYWCPERTRAGSAKQVAAAVGGGASAAMAIREYLRKG